MKIKCAARPQVVDLAEAQVAGPACCPACGAALQLPAGPGVTLEPVRQPMPPMPPPMQVPPPGPSLGDNAGMRLLLPVGLSGWAIAAGYVGLLSIMLLPSPVAILLSIVAIRDIRKHPDKHGLGRAIFGLVMGIGGMLVLGWLALTLAA